MDLVLTGVIVALALVAIVAFKLIWRVAEPNEAIIISGLGARGRETLGFNIVTGKGALVVPGVRAARRVSRAGGGARGRETPGCKMVTGKGALVGRGFQAARRISLDSRVSPLEVN